MSKLVISAGIAFALILTLIGSQQSHGQNKQILIEVCVLNDQNKGVFGVQIHILPTGQGDPKPQTTDNSGCLRFQIDPTTSFSITFFNAKGEIIGVQRGLAGFESTIVRVNYQRMSLESKDNTILRLAAIRSYTEILSTRATVQPKVIEMLNGMAIRKQVETLSSKLADTTSKGVHEEIISNIGKLSKR